VHPNCFRQLLGYLIVGFMLLMTVHALGEMAVMYPVNGAFFEYALRFIDPSWYVLRWWRSRHVRTDLF
jgi:amino acid transporter